MNYGLLPVAKCLVAGPARTLDNKIEPTESRLNFIGREKNAPVEPIVEALHRLLMSYPRLKRRRDKIQSLLSCLVKPDGFTEISYIG